MVMGVGGCSLAGGELMVLAGYPAGTVFVDFLLPNGDNLLYPVHHLVAGVEGFLPVGRSYGDYQASINRLIE